jgi:hypothetical protein
MVRVKKEVQNNRIAELEAKIAALEAKASVRDPSEEIRSVRNKNRGDSGGLTYKHFTDHKKVVLWHTNGIHIGKKVGPLHPDSLENTFDRFKAKGVILSPNQPTAEQVSAYMKTEEYKGLEKKLRTTKAMRFKGPETKEDIKRLTDAMVRIAGMNPKDVVSLKPQEAVV